jgi:hypothetical protein
MTDLDAAIIAALVSGLSEREVCRQLGCTIGEVRAALDARAARRTVAGMRAESLETFDALEQAWAVRAKAGGRGSKAPLRQIRRQRARLTL